MTKTNGERERESRKKTKDEKEEKAKCKGARACDAVLCIVWSGPTSAEAWTDGRRTVPTRLTDVRRERIAASERAARWHGCASCILVSHVRETRDCERADWRASGATTGDESEIDMISAVPLVLTSLTHGK